MKWCCVAVVAVALVCGLSLSAAAAAPSHAADGAAAESGSAAAKAVPPPPLPEGAKPAHIPGAQAKPHKAKAKKREPKKQPKTAYAWGGGPLRPHPSGETPTVFETENDLFEALERRYVSLSQINATFMRAARDSEMQTLTSLPVLGDHYIVELYLCNRSVIANEALVKQIVTDAILHGNGTMMSILGHHFDPGVTVLALLAESHISIHTWPEHRYAAVDVFTCGKTANPEKMGQYIEKHFGGNPLETLWSHRVRGGPTYVSDLHSVHQLNMRRYMLASEVSKYQHVTVYDIPTDNTLNSGASSGFGRVLFLDGSLQSAQSDEYIYHEALVHPALLAHPNPKRVMIVGGGEGATLREVLRHKTVEKVIMVELDETVSRLSYRFMPTFHAGAFNDSRVDLRFEDGLALLAAQPDGSLDVIIMDVLDPGGTIAQEVVPQGYKKTVGGAEELWDFDHKHVIFSNPLFKPEFYDTCYRKLSPYGVLITNTGEISLPELSNDLEQEEEEEEEEDEEDEEEEEEEDEDEDEDEEGAMSTKKLRLKKLELETTLQVYINMRYAMPGVTQFMAYVPSFQANWMFTLGIKCPKHPDGRTCRCCWNPAIPHVAPYNVSYQAAYDYMQSQPRRSPHNKNPRAKKAAVKSIPQTSGFYSSCAGHRALLSPHTRDVSDIVNDEIYHRLPQANLLFYDGLTHRRMLDQPKEWRDYLRNTVPAAKYI